MRKSLTALCVLVIAGSALAADTGDFPIVVNFDRYDNGISNDSNDMLGRLHVPENPAGPVPLIVFYHGLGETGSNSGYNNTAQVNGNINNLFNAAKANGWMVYAPQTYSGWGIDQVDNTVSVLGRIVTEYNVDTSRIYVSGLSLGGGATWTALGQYKDVFAAGVPVCGVSDGNLGQITANMTNTPIWAYHADNDGTVNVSASRNMVNNIRAADGKSGWTFGSGANSGAPYYADGSRYYQDGDLRYSEYDSGGHGIWGRAYNESALYPWMLDHTNEIATIQNAETVRFNTGWSTYKKEDQIDGKYWNHFTYGLHKTPEIVRAFARTDDDANRNTSLMLEIVDPFATEGGANTASVDGTSWIVWSNNPANAATMKLHGLQAGGEYSVECGSAEGVFV